MVQFKPILKLYNNPEAGVSKYFYKETEAFQAGFTDRVYLNDRLQINVDAVSGSLKSQGIDVLADSWDVIEADLMQDGIVLRNTCLVTADMIRNGLPEPRPEFVQKIIDSM